MRYVVKEREFFEMSNKKFVKKLLPIIMAPSLVFGVALQAGNNMPAYAAEGTWIYVDGANGNDSNDGSSADKAVKSWDVAKDKLGCSEGGIYVVGTVQAEGTIYTKQPDKQSVKRTSDIVMFEVPGGATATFANIDVDGEDKHFESEVVKPNTGTSGQYTRVNYLTGAVFHNIGYNPGPQAAPDVNAKGGKVTSLEQYLTILVDGAEFKDNQGLGAFIANTPSPTVTDGKANVNAYVKSVTFTGNSGYFYFNESATTNNKLYVYNALVRNNDASLIGERYTTYALRTGVIYVCDLGIMGLRSQNGLAAFDNSSYDLMWLDDFTPESRIRYGNYSGPGDYTKMAGGGSYELPGYMPGGGAPNYKVTDAYNAEYYWGVTSNPSQEDKDKAVAAATSVFENNTNAVIDANGMIYFGTGFDDNTPDTPTVTIDQTCEDETETTTSSSEEESSSSEEESSSSEEESSSSEEESSSSKKEGSLATTVSVDGNSSTESKSVEVEAGTYSVDDTITYTDLTGGATYIIKGQLVCVDDETVIRTKDEEFVADDSGYGTWTVTFENVNLEAGKKYVVYEAAVNKDDANDKAEHKDKTAKAQTVVVKKESETTTSEEETTASEEGTTTSKEETTTSKEETTTSKEETTTSKEETTTSKEETTTSKEETTTSKEEATTSKEETTTSKEETTTSKEETTTSKEETTTSKKGELATIVKADGKTASADAELRLTFDETKAVQTINDTITYTNLVKGVTYTVTGTIVEIDENGKIINPEVATNTIECVADDVNGEWEMNFENVTIQPLKKYVVFESAYAAGGEDENATQENPITHKDVNDKAQTIITEGENEKILDDVEEGSTSATVIASADSNENNGGSDNNSGNNNGNNGGSNSNGSSSKGTSGPNTGDSANTALYVTAAVAAAGIAVTSIALGTKKRSKRR